MEKLPGLAEYLKKAAATPKFFMPQSAKFNPQV